MKPRESLGSRLGFIFLSAGCAIGIGNVWRFPYVVGNYGGGIFVLFYLIFLVILGLPVLTMEFAIGRSSQRSIITAYQKLEKPGDKWHWHGVHGMVGNYILMFFYTSVAGWMLSYFVKYLSGSMEGITEVSAYEEIFGTMLGNPLETGLFMLIIVLVSILICSLGLQNGVERVTKWMMGILLVLIVVLAVHSLTLPGAAEGLKFYLVPNMQQVQEIGLIKIIVEAMNQSFFTLSLGIGAMLIFGSYLPKDHTLLGQSMQIILLDTFVAITSGLIIFPACASFGVNVKSGPALIFHTLPNVFSGMTGSRVWGTLFFLFMTFAALSTVVAVIENLLACCMDKFHWSRGKACIVNFVIITVFSIPCVLGYNLWSNIQPMGGTILDFEDFLVSNLLLPIGSLIFVLFCVSKKHGWGFKNYLDEVNTGVGIKMPSWIRPYVTYVLPVIVAIIIVISIGSKLFPTA